MNNKRNNVFDAIESERQYQELMIAKVDRPDMIEDLHIGDTLAAMQYNLDKAREAWYKGSTPHQGAMEYIRKVCGLGVQAGEKYGMPYRVVETENKCPYFPEVPVSKCETECICEVKSSQNEGPCSYHHSTHGCMLINCECAKVNKNG